jgi:hypothetical protein
MTSQTQLAMNSFVTNPNLTIRICKKDAHELLMSNTKVLGPQGEQRYLQIMPLGLDVYAVKLLPVNWDTELGTIALAPCSKWITTEKTLHIKPSHACKH